MDDNCFRCPNSIRWSRLGLGDELLGLREIVFIEFFASPSPLISFSTGQRFLQLWCRYFPRPFGWRMLERPYKSSKKRKRSLFCPVLRNYLRPSQYHWYQGYIWVKYGRLSHYMNEISTCSLRLLAHPSIQLDQVWITYSRERSWSGGRFFSGWISKMSRPRTVALLFFVLI